MLNATHTEIAGVANITLISDPENNNVTNGSWYCKNMDRNNLCLKLRVFNQNCDGIETISISVTGGGTYRSSTYNFLGQVNPFYVFSMKNEISGDNGEEGEEGEEEFSYYDFLTLSHDWDWFYAPGSFGDVGDYGVVMAPNCGIQVFLTQKIL